MNDEHLQPDNPVLRVGLSRLYREFFDRAEKKRRWSLREDVPWTDVNGELSPQVADVVEAFCTVELYLPDYLGKALPMLRKNRAWSHFHANWGYEESKHSLALGDWLLRSGARTEEQMADLEARTYQHEWNLPHDSAQGMVIYAMVQELATFLHYRNLRRHIEVQGDPALSRLLQLIGIDERAHHTFYLNVVQIYLQIDRPSTLEQLGRVLHGFKMPAMDLLAESRQRMADIKDLNVFNEGIYVREVYLPILDKLGVERRELRASFRLPKSAAEPVAS
jgi:acyl-[acyl-carrier-protein] desaturase